MAVYHGAEILAIPDSKSANVDLSSICRGQSPGTVVASHKRRVRNRARH